jgi:hypothetical protein
MSEWLAKPRSTHPIRLAAMMVAGALLGFLFCPELTSTIPILGALCGLIAELIARGEEARAKRWR